MNGLTPPRWRRIQELCELVEYVAPAQREARLRELELDPVVRREVLELLQGITDEGEQQDLYLSAALDAAGAGRQTQRRGS